MWLIYAITAAMIWGLDYSLGEKIFNYRISPISLLAVQMLLGSIIFFVVGWRTHLVNDINNILNNKVLCWTVIGAIITFNLGNLLIFLSIQAKSATIAGLIELSYPIFTVLFTWLLFKVNHFSLGLLFGGLLIFAGIGVISFFSS